MPDSSSNTSYFLHSYGCQMNKLDSELVESRLVEHGFEPAPTEEAADVVLLNTCSVRQHAEDRVWSRLGRLRKRKRGQPELVVGVLGCMAQEHSRLLQARMPHVDLVVGPSAFGDIHEKIAEARCRNLAVRDADRGAGLVSVAGATARDIAADPDRIQRNVAVRPHPSQAYISVMRGCNMPCTYCIVPLTRGKEISRPIDAIHEEALRLVADGVTEITLLGQTVNAYGRDLGRDVNLSRLLRRLHEIESLRRLAFVTSHPNFLSVELAETIADLPRVSRYLHLPVQSGSDRVLRAMKRGYTVSRYLERVELLRERVPEIELQSDFIVGFPGETEEDFEQTVALMERLRFAQSFIFKYSPRPGTSAAELVDDVVDAEKARRNAVLLEVQGRHSAERHRELVGSVAEVLVEGWSKVAGRMTGRTMQHRLVHFPTADVSLIGRYVSVRITEGLAHSMLGELVENADAQATLMQGQV